MQQQKRRFQMIWKIGQQTKQKTKKFNLPYNNNCLCNQPDKIVTGGNFWPKSIRKEKR